MKTVHLPYGVEGLDVAVPDSAIVVDPTDAPALDDEQGSVLAALRSPHSGPPLSELVRGAERVAVVFPDLTRPMPNTTVLPPLLGELETLGFGPDRVELLCATGTHRRATGAEMSALVGQGIFSRYDIHDHSATLDEHVVIGRVDGTDVRVDRHYLDADVRILTGFVEPHFFAGFSGGPKGLCPGLADLDTVLEAHSRGRIADLNATWTVMEGNPVHDFIRAAVALAPPTLSIDVTIDRDRRLTGVFCGPLPDAHRAACRSVTETSVTTLEGTFDVVVSTNGGHPLDRNLYQAVKGMAAAERVVSDGGTIVMAAECSDGVPEGGAFERLLRSATDVRSLVAGGAEADGWQAQVLGRVLSKADVWLHSRGLADEQVELARMRPVDDVGSAVERAMREHGEASTLCVLVRGPLAVATSIGVDSGPTPAAKGVSEPNV